MALNPRASAFVPDDTPRPVEISHWGEKILWISFNTIPLNYEYDGTPTGGLDLNKAHNDQVKARHTIFSLGRKQGANQDPPPTLHAAVAALMQFKWRTLLLDHEENNQAIVTQAEFGKLTLEINKKSNRGRSLGDCTRDVLLRGLVRGSNKKELELSKLRKRGVSSSKPSICKMPCNGIGMARNS
ncbi:hypothetical protein T439DRAFT_381639 [Meredithblackwellia eburnea MCA 4105]